MDFKSLQCRVWGLMNCHGLCLKGSIPLPVISTRSSFDGSLTLGVWCWQICILPKFFMFLWHARNAYTGLACCSRPWYSDYLSLGCNAREMLDHVLLSCPFSRSIWVFVLAELRNMRQPRDLNVVLLYLKALVRFNWRNTCLDALAGMIYSIW